MNYKKRIQNQSQRNLVMCFFHSSSILVLLCTLSGCGAKFNNPSKPSSPATLSSVDTLFQYPKKLLFGQSSFNIVDNADKGMSAPRRIFSDGKRFYLSDAGNHRVLIYNSVPTSRVSPDVVLGQVSSSHLGGANFGGVSAQSLNNPSGMWVDGTRLYLADSGNHRVLIWNSIPTSNRTPADIVLGQPDFNSNLANAGITVGANTMNSPTTVMVQGNRLFVVDSSNVRILVWNNKAALTTGAAADYVIGQPNFTTVTTSCSGTKLRAPSGIASDGTQLLISDQANGHRVLIYTSIPTVSGAAAQYVIGQTNLTTCTANAGGRSASTLSDPSSVMISQGKVFVVDYVNNRVLVWNSIPNANSVGADLVLGQANFSVGFCNQGSKASASTFCAPVSIATDGTRLLVTDRDNNRVVGWNSIPTVSSKPADFVVGQPSLADYTRANFGLPGAAEAYNQVNFTFVGGGKFMLSSVYDNRFLIWNSIPSQSNVSPDLVLGQPDMNSVEINNDSGGPSARTLKTPRGSWTDGTRLVLADSDNNRILIWSTFPKASYTPADIVLGQPDFTSTAANAGSTVNSKTLANPSIVVSDGKRLLVTDRTNNRILIWNTFPTENYTPADVVLGQPNMTTSTANTGGRSAFTLNSPLGLQLSSGKIIVVDRNNYRILIWNSIPQSNGTPADVVLGQTDFASAAITYFSDISAVLVANGRLFTTGDIGKVHVWNKIPTVIGTPIDGYIGFFPASRFGPSEHTSADYSSQIAASDTHLFVPGGSMGRLIAHPMYPVHLATSNITNSASGKLTASDCTDHPFIAVTEGRQPAQDDSIWQECSTAPGGITYDLESLDNGIHELKVWSKNSLGQVRKDSMKLPVAFDNLAPFAPAVKLNSASSSSNPLITLTLGNCSDTPSVLVTETNAIPAAESTSWQKCSTSAGAISHTLVDRTLGLKTVYLWGKDAVGNVSTLPTSTTMTLTP